METVGLPGHSGNRFDASLPVSDLTFCIWCTPGRAPHQPGSPNTSSSLLCFHPACTWATWMVWDRTPFWVGLGTPPQGRLLKNPMEIGGQEYWQVSPINWWIKKHHLIYLSVGREKLMAYSAPHGRTANCASMFLAWYSMETKLIWLRCTCTHICLLLSPKKNPADWFHSNLT